ncbi:MAG TPA: carboxypeptidase regulatory-like domain-containing protein, partial [Candidatus Polarisedimenticolia bacterium]|nr:carboxypeptidase regulatory-like domain-containing protein [Candidatus Polarisedimenticolia bacterium]
MRLRVRGAPAAVAAVVLFIVFGLSGTVRAQTSGEIRGVVTDTTGVPLPGVTVVASGSAGLVSQRGSVTDAQGKFRIGTLPAAGDYEVRASLPGRSTVVMTGVQVVAGQVTQVNLSLTQSADLREQVTVKATPPVVDVAQTTTTTRLSSEFLDALPILGRDYQDALVLAPGVTDVDGDGNPNIHGSRDTDIGTLVDGVSTTDPLTGKVGAQLNLESIQEVEIKTSGATAEFGRAQGGMVNILTKSGGNDFEGVFKFFWRSSKLDGDGAGFDDPRLHAGLGEIGLRELTFDDYLPFLSLSGPMVKDKAWYFVALEYISKETPVNALSTAFVTGEKEWRQFGKATWEATPSWRFALSLNHDPQEFTNQGLNSITRLETGYTLEQGGLVVTARGTGVLSPSVALETTLSWFDGTPATNPNMGPDNNFNGVLSIDRNNDGFADASERDPGEDYDGDGAFDLFEDYNTKNGLLDYTEVCCYYDRTMQETVCTCPPFGPGPSIVDEDADGDRRLTPPGVCEGALREDTDCDGNLDRIFEDRNRNGRVDPNEDRDGDGRLDRGDEDRNANNRLDDSPFPTSTYPYGHLRPTPEDRDYSIDLLSGFVSGPFYEAYDDDRTRATLRQDLSVFTVASGSHDIKTGFLVERESFHRDNVATDVVGLKDPGYFIGTILDQVLDPTHHYTCNPYGATCVDPNDGRISVAMPVERNTTEEATGFSTGLYVQDLYRPLPNLSIGLGLRFDRETADSSGYTFFDPAAEHATYGRLVALAGREANVDDLIGGNADGLRSLGFTDDALFEGTVNQAWLDENVLSVLSRVALRTQTINHDSGRFLSGELANQFPDLFSDGTLDPVALREAGVPVQAPEEFTVTNNNLAPRLSVSWDPWSDGRTKGFATWGRYYDKLFLSSVTGEQGTERVLRYYQYDRTGLTLTPGLDVADVPNHKVGTLLSKSPPSVTQVDRSLQTPYCDEWTIGFERELAPELALAVRYIDRSYRDQLQDIDLNHQVRIDPTSGLPLDRFGGLTVVPALDPQGNPIPGAAPDVTSVSDGRPDLFLNNPFFNEVLRVGNYNAAA